jgi:hypothetical protein
VRVFGPMSEDMDWVWDLNAADLARAYLSSDDDDVRQEAYERARDIESLAVGGLFEQWLIASINLSAEVGGAGSVGAGPLEATLERDPRWIPILETACDAAALNACLSYMWLDGAVEPVLRWVQARLGVGPDYDGHIVRE